MNLQHQDRRASVGLAAVLGLALTAAVTSIAGEEPSDLELLNSWMTGTFSSAAQAAEDPEFLDISLQMTPIWSGRTDGRWLYVEQALRENLDRPYRQRVYRLRELVPGLFESQVFTLPDPTAVVGAWRLEQPLADLEPTDLSERDGCAILLRRRDATFVGSTLGSLCTSDLRGAAYATSEVVITPDGMVSWDRGFSADGGQVWGSTRGGYVFDRIVDVPEPGTETEDGTGAEAESVPTPVAAPAETTGSDGSGPGGAGNHRSDADDGSGTTPAGAERR